MYEPSTTNENDDICPGCHGARVQYNRQTGMNQTCPVCYGTGRVPKTKRGIQYWCSI